MLIPPRKDGLTAYYKLTNLRTKESTSFKDATCVDIFSRVIDVRLWNLERVEIPTGLKALRVQDFVRARKIADPIAYQKDLEYRRLT